MSLAEEKVLAARGELDQLIESQGLSIYHLESPRGYQGVLRIYIYRDLPSRPGIGLDECTVLVKELTRRGIVDRLLSFDQTLEVSTPGINRPLVSKAHYCSAVGERISVSYSLDSLRTESVVGELIGVLDGEVEAEDGLKALLVRVESCSKKGRKGKRASSTNEADGVDEIEIPFEKILKGRVDFRFD